MKKLTSYSITDKLIIAIGAIGAIIASCTPVPVAAQEVSSYSVVIHGVSKHSGDRVYNETNTGAALRYQADDSLSYQVGIYKNSYNKTTVYVGAQYTPLHIGGSVKLGGFAGFASGYSHISKLPLSAGLLGDVAITQQITLTVRHVPKISKVTDSVTALELGLRF